jgi:Molecular chaperone GrpE (heat shock protein)
MQDTPPASPNIEQTPTGEQPSPAADCQDGQIDAMPGLAELLRQAELKAEEHHDAWLRAKAETENLRRRAQEDIAKAHKYAAEKFATEMLPVKDSLEAALAIENCTVDSLKSGVELTLKQLIAAFEKSRTGRNQPGRREIRPAPAPAISTL